MRVTLRSLRRAKKKKKVARKKEKENTRLCLSSACRLRSKKQSRASSLLATLSLRRKKLRGKGAVRIFSHRLAAPSGEPFTFRVFIYHLAVGVNILDAELCRAPGRDPLGQPHGKPSPTPSHHLNKLCIKFVYIEYVVK